MPDPLKVDPEHIKLGIHCMCPAPLRRGFHALTLFNMTQLGQSMVSAAEVSFSISYGTLPRMAVRFLMTRGQRIP